MASSFLTKIIPARVAALALLGALLFPAAAFPQDSGYRLGAGDQVRLRAFEWRPSIDQVFEWEALSNEFTVGPSGQLSVPLVGEIQAAGLTTAEAAEAIALGLQERLNLLDPPDTSLEIVAYRSFYVTGDVTNAGPFPYRPGLTVLQAVAIAGGLRERPDYGPARLERDVVSIAGDLDLLAQSADALQVRRARLRAELDEAEAITLPEELAARAGEAAIVRLVADETLILQSRREAFHSQRDALEQLKLFLAQEVTSLQAQLETIDRQMDLTNQELDGVLSLVQQGLATAPRQLALERTVAELQGDRLNMETTLLRARQEISRADIAIIDLSNKRANETSIELRDIEVSLEENSRRAVTSRALLYEAQVIAPQRLNEWSGVSEIEPVYTIVRENGAAAGDVVAAESTAVGPGDTVRVVMPLPLRIAVDTAVSASAASPLVQ
jgi:polysaccharide export outer membrane protein/exopolysaccharide production protein ExoF